MGLFSSALDLFHGGGEGKAAKAQGKALQKSMQFYEPYYKGGQEAYGNFQNFLNQMQNPTEYYDTVMDAYQPSRAFQNRLNRGLDILNNNAAQNGTFGMGASQKEIADYMTGLLNEDEQTFWNNIMGVGNQYLSGEQYLTNLGYDAGGNLANLTTQKGIAKGNQSRAFSNALNDYIGKGINMGANAMTGGAAGVMSPYTSDYRLRQSWGNGGY